jgi:AcrR family transcriptional regulator
MMAAAAKDESSVRQHIITVADDLLYRNGIRAVGVDAIVEAADIAKATLYRHFRSKEDVVVACLMERRRRLESAFAQHAALGASVGERIGAVFDMLTTTLESGGFRGCAFLMAVAEHGESERIREAAHGYKLFIRDHFRTMVDGLATDPDDLAERLALVYEGAIAVAMIRPEARPAVHAKQCAELLLRASPGETKALP